jgi:uridine phosphorylase
VRSLSAISWCPTPRFATRAPRIITSNLRATWRHAAALAAIEVELWENNHEYIRGKTWTTDAVYRETRARMNRRRREGCPAVEMEEAAFFTVARFRGLECAQILYGGDTLAGRQWNPRGWNRNATRERPFHLAAEAFLRL